MYAKKLILPLILIVSAGGLLLGFYYTQPHFDSHEYVATIDNRIGIKRTDLVEKVRERKQFITWSGQTDDASNTVEKEMLDEMIDTALEYDYLSKHSLHITQEEIERRYKDASKSQTDEQFQEKIKQAFGITKEQYYLILKDEIAKDKVQQDTGKVIVDWLKEERKSHAIHYLSET